MSRESELQQMAAARLPEHARFPRPGNEVNRLASLLEYDVLDTLPERSYDELTAIAAHICGAPIALVSLLDGDRQWFKSHYGIDAIETPREHAFCAHAILNPQEVLVVGNALEDERFKNNPLVTDEPNIRFYAGTPLVNPEGMPLGTLCVIDRTPRELTPQQSETLQALGRQVIAQLELRRKAAQLQKEKQELKQALQNLKMSQANLIESEKMSAIGELVVDLAQKLNNPLTLVQGNLEFGQKYVQQLLELIDLYRGESTSEETVESFAQKIELDDMRETLPRLFFVMKNRVKQVRDTILSLQTFTLHDEAGIQHVNIHDNLDAVCKLLNSYFQETATQPAVKLVKQYSELPCVPCKPAQLNQALMHLISNAIDAVRQGVGPNNPDHSLPQVTIATSLAEGNTIQISISDNGLGTSDKPQSQMFMRSYSAGKVDMGLVISRRIIVQEHSGSLNCQSTLGLGTEMVVTLPIQVPNHLCRIKS